MASEKVTAMIEEVKALSVLELSELVHALEETFGVSAAAAAVAAAPVAAAAVEEKTEFDVVMTDFGAGFGYKTDAEMLKTKNFGRKSLNEIKALLAEHNLSLGMNYAGWVAPEEREEEAQGDSHRHDV